MDTYSVSQKKIVDCEITKGTYENSVWVAVSYIGWVSEMKLLFTYYPDELSFNEDEFIGLTEDEAMELFHKKDVEYLRS